MKVRNEYARDGKPVPVVAGVVQSVAAKAGGTVDQGAVLAVVEAAAP